MIGDLIVPYERHDLLPTITTAKNFDHFRGTPNTISRPSMYDDGHLPKANIEDVKAYIYPAEEDSLLWARWGGSGFDMHHCSQIVTQSFDQTEDDNAIGDSIGHQRHFNMIRPAFSKDAGEEDINAFGRRSHVCALMKDAV